MENRVPVKRSIISQMPNEASVIRKSAVLISAVCLLVLPSCGGSPDIKSESDSDSKECSSVEEMRSALLDVGGICAEWTITTGTVAFAETAKCDNSFGSVLSPEREVLELSLYKDENKLTEFLVDKRDTYLQYPEVAKQYVQPTAEILLVGSIWMIKSYSNQLDNLTVFQENFGGQIISSLDELSEFTGLESTTTTKSEVSSTPETEAIVDAIMPVLEQNGIVDRSCVLSVVDSLSQSDLEKVGNNDPSVMTGFLKELESCL